MGQQGGSNTGKWILGCSLGCLAVAILGIIAVVAGGYFLMNKGMEMVGQEMARSVKAEYDTLKSGGKIPAEHVATFDELYAVTQDPNAGAWSIMLAGTGIMGPARDGSVTPEEMEHVTAIRDFVKANPDCSMIEMAQFAEQHPEIQNWMEALDIQPPFEESTSPPATE